MMNYEERDQAAAGLLSGSLVTEVGLERVFSDEVMDRIAAMAADSIHRCRPDAEVHVNHGDGWMIAFALPEDD